MLQVVTLFLALQAPPDPLTIKGEFKDVPAQGKDGPSLLVEGTTNLPNGIALMVLLYYGKPLTGKELFKDSPIVKGGKFSQEFRIFAERNFPGSYTARFVYDPVLQGLDAPDYPRTAVDFPLKIGDDRDFDRESKGVRDQVIGEIRGLTAIADKIKAKLDEMKDKPQAEREVPFKAWHEESNEIRRRLDPRKHPEYYILRLDLLADTGMEDLTGILMSSARCFVLNQRGNTLEGLTRLRQSCEYWIGEISSPRLTDFSKMVATVEECRSIARKLLDKSDEPLLPSRRRFLELTALLDKSISADYHEVILGITDRANAFFNAVSDKSPDTKKLHADLDGLLERFGNTLRK